jgi:hypothetical protein
MPEPSKTDVTKVQELATTSTASTFTTLCLANNLPAPVPHVNAQHKMYLHTNRDEEHIIKETGVQINNKLY